MITITVKNHKFKIVPTSNQVFPIQNHFSEMKFLDLNLIKFVKFNFSPRIKADFSFSELSCRIGLNNVDTFTEKELSIQNEHFGNVYQKCKSIFDLEFVFYQKDTIRPCARINVKKRLKISFINDGIHVTDGNNLDIIINAHHFELFKLDSENHDYVFTSESSPYVEVMDMDIGFVDLKVKTEIEPKTRPFNSLQTYFTFNGNQKVAQMKFDAKAKIEVQFRAFTNVTHNNEYMFSLKSDDFQTKSFEDELDQILAIK